MALLSSLRRAGDTFAVDRALTKATSLALSIMLRDCLPPVRTLLPLALRPTRVSNR
jgi:hypothetical protein